MKRILSVPLLTIIYLLSPISGPARAQDIRADSILLPVPNSRTPVAIPTEITVRFTNTGSSDLRNVPLSAVVIDPTGLIVYRDTIVDSLWPAGASLDSSFEGWIPAMSGSYSLLGIALSPNDKDRANDTARAQVLIAYETDVKADSILDPSPGEDKVPGTRWQPEAEFESIGATDVLDLIVRVRIIRCSDGLLVFQADSILPELNIDAGRVPYRFPSTQGFWDIAKLKVGCYTMIAIARDPRDGDRTNDTAWSTFYIGDAGVSQDETPPALDCRIYPNPATASASVMVTTCETGNADVFLVDPLGRNVRRVFAGELQAGEYRMPLDVTGLTPGMYECIVRLGDRVQRVGVVVER